MKRGDFLLCQPIAEGDKVKAEIVHVLYKENIQYIVVSLSLLSVKLINEL